MSQPLAAVTGGGSGIGAAICAELGRRGFHVVVTDVDVAAAEAAARGIASAEFHRLDVTRPAVCDELVERIV
jgi:NAD(P)-dependent dehydrogenase (short-subunit alcohol dehydrogenase family)